MERVLEIVNMTTANSEVYNITDSSSNIKMPFLKDERNHCLDRQKKLLEVLCEFYSSRLQFDSYGKMARLHLKVQIFIIVF